MEDLLKDEALLSSLPLTAEDLAFLKDVRKHSARGLENTLLLMEAKQKGQFRKRWDRIGAG